MVAFDDATKARLTTAAWCGFYASGIIGTLVAYGLIQERIMTIPYGGESFSWSVLLVFFNRLAAVAFSLVMAMLHRESLMPGAPLWKYLVVSLSNVFASTCQYEALKYVSFAVQMLGKSFKMLPVMVWGIAISQKRYNARDWLVAILVTGGVTEFLCTGPTHSVANHGSSLKGFVLLLVFLALDGLTSTMQEKLFKEHSVSKYNQMAYVNLLSSVVSLITLFSTRSAGPAFSFCGNHGDFLRDAFFLSLAAVGSQFFIYSHVKEFGALVFAATMNVRQVVSIVISYVKFHHHITWGQVIGLILVFGALFYKSYVGLMGSRDDGEKQALVPKDPPEMVESAQEVEQNAPKV